MLNSHKKVLIIAGVSWNTMIYVDELPQPVEQSVFPPRYHDTVGSSGAGKALNIGRIMPTKFFGLIGDDAYGTLITDYFAQQPVDFFHHIDPNGTKRHVNLMAANGDRISLLINNGSQETVIDWHTLEDEIISADYLSVTAYNHTRSLLPLIAKHNKPLWLDIHDYDGKNPHWADYIEAASVIQLSSSNFLDHRAWMEKMLRAGKQAILCTHGVNGSSALTQADGWLEVPAILSDNMVDTNGAGDSFFTGVLFGRASGFGWLKSMRMGSLVAKMTVESAELYSPDLSIDTLIQQYAYHFGDS